MRYYIIKKERSDRHKDRNTRKTADLNKHSKQSIGMKLVRERLIQRGPKSPVWDVARGNEGYQDVRHLAAIVVSSEVVFSS